MNTVSLNSITSRIGTILKLYREKTGRKQGPVAKQAGISTSMLSQIERGMVSPSIDTLSNVCTALGIDIAGLFSRLSPRESVRIHRAEGRLKTEHGGIVYEQIITSPDNTHPAEMFMLSIKPGCSAGVEQGGHEGVEMGYVISGEGVLTVAGNEYELSVGDSVSFTAALPHCLENRGRSMFKAVWNALPPHNDYLEMERKTK